MPVLILRRSQNILEWSTTLLGTSSQDSANPVSRLLSRPTGEFWRTPGTVEAATETAIPTSGTGTAMGSATVQLGKENGADGSVNRATIYRNTSTSNAYVLSTIVQVKARRRYTITLQARRTKAATKGSASVSRPNSGTKPAIEPNISMMPELRLQRAPNTELAKTTALLSAQLRMSPHWGRLPTSGW